MKYKYSLALDTFYPVDMLDAYTDLPIDLMDVSEQTHDAVLHARTQGQGLAYRIADDGASVSVAPSATHDWDEKAGKWVFNAAKQADLDAQAAKQAATAALTNIKQSLQAHIDSVAQSLGFSNGNSVILYAGFDNPFKTLATQFGAWEAGIWVLANQYMAQVKAGEAPMLTPTQAVERVPSFDFTGA